MLLSFSSCHPDRHVTCNTHLNYQRLKAIYVHDGFSVPVSTIPPEFLGGRGSNLSVREARGLIWKGAGIAGTLLTVGWRSAVWLEITG